MADIETVLSDIRQLARKPSDLSEAESKLIALIDELSTLELSEAQGVIRDVIQSSFLPKRRKRLLERVAHALAGTGVRSGARSQPPFTSEVRLARDALAVFKTEFHASLIDLADRHIFQWPYYETLASHLFDVRAPRAMAEGIARTELSAVLREEIAAHSKEAFQRTFAYATDRQKLSRERALTSANVNLPRFLNVAVSEYRRQLMRLRFARRAADFRGLCSALVSGVLLGRCRVSFGSLRGCDQLIESWKLWAQYLPFMTLSDLERLGMELPAGLTRDRLFRVSRPLAAALDEQVARADAHRVCVLRETSYSARFDRLELTLVEPIQAAEKEIYFHCYLSDAAVDRAEIESAFNRGMQLIMAPLTDELERWAWRHEQALRDILIDTSKKDAFDRLRDLLSIALATLGSGKLQDIPITFNFARRFPLDKPDIGADFRVPRYTVRRLLEQHHSETGVRLWCSVRRSGKSTACLDLQAHRGPEIVITETCERTGAANLKDSFYQTAVEALGKGTQLPQTFVVDAIRRAADYDVGRSRIVFVLDEYESLFRQLETTALENEGIRYRVVQPLLNQLLEFSQQNLLILMGLRPDAHFILMDQNQLSPYVRADQFPLFEFIPNHPDCEFRDLVRRVLTERIQCDDAFVGHLYGETGGHPVLTVNLLVSLCEWLIETRRPLSQLRLGASDFEAFSGRHLTVKAVALNEVYDTHRKFAQQGLSDRSRERMPWLYAVLHVLRYIATSEEGRMSCSVSDVTRLLERLGLDKSPGIDAQDLVRTGAMANFFKVTDRTVKPGIRLLARLTASVVPAVQV